MSGGNLFTELGYSYYELVVWLQLLSIFALPIVLSIWNIVGFVGIIRCKNGEFKEIKLTKYLEVFGVLSGLFCTIIAWHNIAFVSWWEEIDYNSVYPPIAEEYSLTFYVLSVLGLIGYFILRFISKKKQSPLVTVISISAMYSQMILCFIFCIQVILADNDATWQIMIILPINMIILYTKVILLIVQEKSKDILQTSQSNNKYIALLEKHIKKASDYPKLALVLLLPYLVIIVILLILFGQKPDSLVAMWTDTAEWNLSTKIPPPRLDYKGHYLCTVAVCGTPALVKPLWIGQRSGQKILVNRQLAVANAFEQILEEKTPKLHSIIRGVYDKTGYPISKHITSKFSSNLTYLVMKPLEWVFILVLYLVDINPENRIYNQYRNKNNL